MKVQALIEVQFTRAGVRKALRGVIQDYLSLDVKIDDSDDLYTDDECNSYYSDDADMLISSDKDVSEMVDAYNILLYGKPLKVRGLK